MLYDKNREQAEIPQLQAHCRDLTTKSRLANCRRFLNALNQLSGPLSLWASDDGTGGKLSTSSAILSVPTLFASYRNSRRPSETL